MLLRQQCAEHAQHRQRELAWTPLPGGRQHRGVCGCALAFAWLVAACTASGAAPAGAPDKSAVGTLTAKTTAAPDSETDKVAVTARAFDKMLPPAHAADRAAPARSEREAQVLAALEEGILLRGRHEPSWPDQQPGLYVKSMRLPHDWFLLTFTPPEQPVAGRLTPHATSSSRKPTAPSAAASLNQPGLADYGLDTGHERMPSGHAERPSPPQFADTILQAPSWEMQPDPSQPITRKGNPLRSSVRPAKGNPLRQ